MYRECEHTNPGRLVQAVAAVCAMTCVSCVDGPPPSTTRTDTSYVGTDAGDQRNLHKVEIGRLDPETGEFVADFRPEESLGMAGEGAGPFSLYVALQLPRDAPERLLAETEVTFDEPGYDYTFRESRISCDARGEFRICPAFRVPLYHEADFLRRQERLGLSIALWDTSWRGAGDASVPVHMGSR